MSDDKFILIGLDDSRSKDISEVLGNKTCKKILDYLADTKDASEKDISSALSIPINTVEYNLNKLIKAGLVEKAKNFFWSVKGKKIEMYKLAKKHIVISPKSSKLDMIKLKSVIPVIFIAIALLAAVFAVFLYDNGRVTVTNNSSFEGPKQFSSLDDLKVFLEANSESGNNGGVLGGINRMFSDAVPAAEGAAKGGASESLDLSSSSQSAGSYSNTNIQVEGVDEADIVKNDGKYIYTLSGNKVTIVDAYPAENMNILSTINISGASNLFINKDKMVVFSSSYRYNEAASSVNSKMACYGYRCGGYSQVFTDVYVYNINDHKNPVLLKNISIEGNYQDSRMIGESVYLISSQYVYNSDPVLPMYEIDGVKALVPLSDVYYFDYSDNSYVFNTISSFDISGSDFKSKVYLTGGTGSVYVSEDNIFMTYTKTFDYKDYAKSFSEDVALKLLPDSEKSKVESVMSSKSPYYNQLSQVRKIIFDYSLTLSGSEKEDFDSKYLDLNSKFEENMNKRTQRTVINKIGISEGDISYKSVGEVPGQVLNQFSMDEYSGYFRIATTVGQAFDGNSFNSVYVLDSDMNTVGSLEDLAPGEKIYSARFMQDRAYIVTFKSVDPLFVIDLSSPKDPKVLGYLKIPGYSDYLHPYDKDHVIGIGKDANESIDADKVHSAGAVYYTAILGLKVSMFDVSDFENPKEVSKIIIGERGTDSPALYDHKALLFDREKGILVLPVTLTKLVNRSYGGGQSYEESEQIWQGAYVLNVNADEISLRGKITHNNESSVEKLGPAKDEPVGAIRKDAQNNMWTKFNVLNGISQWRTAASGYEGVVYSDYEIDSFPSGANFRPYFDYSTQIQRSLYMDDILYTVSNSKIKANDIKTLNEIKSVDLGYSDQIYYGYSGVRTAPGMMIE